jgi:hypothetical protein
MNKTITWVIVAALVVLGAWLAFGNRGNDGVKDNAQNGTPNYNSDNGGVVNGPGTNDIANMPVVGTQATSDEIVVDVPKLGDKISSPLVVTGRARGPWYFEASAPVMVIDTTGKVLGQGFVEAQGEWMTTEFVPFKGTIRFDSTNSEGGAVIFMNDNPSGDESRSKYLAVPVFFD